MTLPIDMTGAVWFVSQAIWEWEDVPVAPPPPDAQTTPSPDGTQPGPCEGSSVEPTFVRELVLKGFTFDTRYNWVFTVDSPLAHPWEDDDHSDDAQQQTHRASHPAPDEAPEWPIDPEPPVPPELPPWEDPSPQE